MKIKKRTLWRGIFISFFLSNFKILSLFFYKGKCKAIYILKMFLFLFFNNVLSVKKNLYWKSINKINKIVFNYIISLYRVKTLVLSCKWKFYDHFLSLSIDIFLGFLVCFFLLLLLLTIKIFPFLWCLFFLYLYNNLY